VTAFQPVAPRGYLVLEQEATIMRYFAAGVGAIVACLALSAGAQASVFQFVVPMSGAQEFPGPGDLDGFGTATLLIDDGTAPPSITWDISLSLIDLPLTGAHIHQAPAGVAGSVVVNFSGQPSGSGLQDADLSNVLANPTGFYVNVHNAVFPGGAIRGQLPEPTSIALLTLGALAISRRRR
jgi:hypothetical protein